MPTMMWELDVEPEEGDAFNVTVDQRDIAKFEAEPFGWPITQIQERAGAMFWRYLAWNACQRTGRLKMSWDQWSKKIVEVNPRSDEESGIPADASDPGSPAQ